MKRILLATAFLGASATVLLAAGPKADLNADGQVTKQEFTTIATENFRNADVNGDSLLDEAEVEGLREARRKSKQDAHFDRVDRNGDGALTRDEIDVAKNERREKMSEHRDKRKAEMLERFDTNVDGELSETERQAARAERKDQFGERRRGGPKHGPRGSQRPNPDANGDGFISFDEHMAVSEQLFLRLDANGDGILTQGEGKKRKGRRGGPGGKRGF